MACRDAPLGRLLYTGVSGPDFTRPILDFDQSVRDSPPQRVGRVRRPLIEALSGLQPQFAPSYLRPHQRGHLTRGVELREELLPDRKPDVDSCCVKDFERACGRQPSPEAVGLADLAEVFEPAPTCAALGVVQSVWRFRFVNQ